MNKKLLLFAITLFALLCSSLVVSVDAASTWSRTYGGTGNDVAYSLAETSDGGYVLAGTWDYLSVHYLVQGAMWLVKTDASGNMEWNKTYGEGGARARSVIATSDGGYAMVGSMLVKTDASGNMEWNKTFTGVSLVATSDGGYAIAGKTSSFGAGGNDFLLVKTDALGNMEWNKTYGGTGNDYATSLVATSDGGYAIAGYTDSFGIKAGLDDFLLVKTGSSGNIEWNKTYTGIGIDEPYSLVATADGGYAIAGFTNAIGAAFDFWLVKTDSFGNMEWNKTYREKETGENVAYSLVAAPDGGYAIAGVYMDSATDFTDFLLVKTDANGVMEWNRTYGEGGERAWSVIATPDGGYAIAGQTSSFGAGGNDFWLVKTDKFGAVSEYPSWIIPSLMLIIPSLMVIVTLLIIIYRRKATPFKLKQQSARRALMGLSE